MLKKYISLIILTAFTALNFNLPVFSAVKTTNRQTYKKNVYKKGNYRKPTPKPNSKKVLKGGIQEPQFVIPLIEDETVKTLDKKKLSKKAYKNSAIQDIDTGLKYTEAKSAKTKYRESIINDEPVIFTENNKSFKKTVYTGKVRTEKGEAVVIKPVSKIRTKNTKLKVKDEEGYEKYELSFPELGEKVEFRVLRDVKRNDKIIIPKDSIVYATVGEVSPRAMGGAPAEMTIEKFEFVDKDGKVKDLSGTISSSGYSLSLWIGLVETATTPFLFGLAAPLLRVLPGGQAVVTPRKEYVVYY